MEDPPKVRWECRHLKGDRTVGEVKLHLKNGDRTHRLKKIIPKKKFPVKVGWYSIKKLNGTESQRTPWPVSCDRAIRYSGSVGPFSRFCWRFLEDIVNVCYQSWRHMTKAGAGYGKYRCEILRFTIPATNSKFVPENRRNFTPVSETSSEHIWTNHPFSGVFYSLASFSKVMNHPKDSQPTNREHGFVSTPNRVYQPREMRFCFYVFHFSLVVWCHNNFSRFLSKSSRDVFGFHPGCSPGGIHKIRRTALDTRTLKPSHNFAKIDLHSCKLT